MRCQIFNHEWVLKEDESIATIAISIFNMICNTQNSYLNVH